MMTKEKKKESLGEFIRSGLSALFIAILIRTFAYEPFSIPSTSMVPTLLIGDYLFVSKFAYGFSRYSLPFGPNLFSGRLLFNAPKRGDVVVFKGPNDPETNYVKRLIGLPGDTIQLKEGILHINHDPVKLEKIEDYYYENENTNTAKWVSQYIETLPNDVKHPILKEYLKGEGYGDNTPEYVIPTGYYFMLGDNRDHSGDSRFPKMGYVPEENLVGRAEILFFSTEAKWWQVWKWLSGIRWSRLLKLIH